MSATAELPTARQPPLAVQTPAAQTARYTGISQSVSLSGMPTVPTRQTIGPRTQSTNVAAPLSRPGTPKTMLVATAPRSASAVQWQDPRCSLDTDDGAESASLGGEPSSSSGNSSGNETQNFRPNARPPSVGTCSSNRSLSEMCRICHCEGTLEQPLIMPCYCSGSLRYVHQKCLQQWIKSSQTKSCEVCRYSFIMEAKVKPFSKWEKLDMSTIERRKVLCSVSFHVIAVTCVVWSLYVLIERVAEEIKSGSLDWPFWTKLVVVAIGFTGGLVFMYVQCKMYVQLFSRWKAYNKVIFVQNCPENGPRTGGLAAQSSNADIAQKHRRPSGDRMITVENGYMINVN